VGRLPEGDQSAPESWFGRIFPRGYLLGDIKDYHRLIIHIFIQINRHNFNQIGAFLQHNRGRKNSHIIDVYRDSVNSNYSIGPGCTYYGKVGVANLQPLGEQNTERNSISPGHEEQNQALRRFPSRGVPGNCFDRIYPLLKNQVPGKRAIGAYLSRNTIDGDSSVGPGHSQDPNGPDIQGRSLGGGQNRQVNGKRGVDGHWPGTGESRITRVGSVHHRRVPNRRSTLGRAYGPVGPQNW